MIIPRTCVNKADIRTTIRTHINELVSEMQEVRITTTCRPYPFCGVVVSYQAQNVTSGDSLALVVSGKRDPVTIELEDIAQFDVLPTRVLTPAHAYKQMKEMERIVGL